MIINDLSGRVALVTGGGRGIGRGIADRLAEAGATVLTCARSDLALENHERCDVRDPDAVDGMIDRIIGHHGRLDIVVNNAGGSPEVATADASPRFNASVVSLNLLGPLNVAQAANRAMRSAGGGVIINVGSLSASRPSPGTAAYGAAKAGLLNLTRTLAVEWAPAVRVNMVTPGMILTDAAAEHYGGNAALARVEATVPLGRFGTPRDVANVCAFLAGDDAAYISGAHIEVHGGGEQLAIRSVLDDA